MFNDYGSMFMFLLIAIIFLTCVARCNVFTKKKKWESVRKIKHHPMHLQLFAEDPPAAGDPPAGGEPTGQTGDNGEKLTFSEEELQQRITEETTKLTAKFETDFQTKFEAAKQEWEKTSKMSQDEKEKHELEKKVKELEEKEKTIALRELKADTLKLLNEKDLPANILDLVLADNLENTQKNVDAFKTAFDQAVQTAVEGRLKGTTPKGGSSTVKTTEEQATEQFNQSLNS